MGNFITKETQKALDNLRRKQSEETRRILEKSSRFSHQVDRAKDSTVNITRTR